MQGCRLCEGCIVWISLGVTRYMLAWGRHVHNVEYIREGKLVEAEMRIPSADIRYPPPTPILAKLRLVFYIPPHCHLYLKE